MIGDDASGTEHLLGLVREAQKDFEGATVSSMARRVARIASLLGDSELAVWLGP